MEASNVNNLNGVPNFGHGFEETKEEIKVVEEAVKVEPTESVESVEPVEVPVKVNKKNVKLRT